MEQKTSINPACLQQMLDSAANARDKGQSQFFTPLEFGRLLATLLPDQRRTVVDLSCGTGHLLHAATTEDTEELFGCDIDPVALSPLTMKRRHPRFSQTKTTGDLTRLYPLFQNINFQADCFVLNPPFGLHWYREHLSALAESDLTAISLSFPVRDGHTPHDCIDSTIASLMIALDRCTSRGEGFLIANEATLQRLLFAPSAPYAALSAHVWLHATFSGNVMTGTKEDNWGNAFTTGVIWFARSHREGPQVTQHFDTIPSMFSSAWRYGRKGPDVSWHSHSHTRTSDLWHAVRTENDRLNGSRHNAYNLWLDSQGIIHTHLSLYDEHNPKVDKGHAAQLHSLHGKAAMQLVLQRSSRTALEQAAYGTTWRVEPALKAAVAQAVQSYHANRAPLYPLPHIQRLGYLDEQDFASCTTDLRLNGCRFKAGKDYPIATKTGSVTRTCLRPSLTGVDERIEYTGSELFFLITDENGRQQVFTEQRLLNKETDLKSADLPKGEPLTLEHLVAHFHIPEVPDVATVNPNGYETFLRQLESIARFCGITPRKFQYEDIARAALHTGLICAWDTGLGKTWFMFLWSLLKNGWQEMDGRIVPNQPILLVAPEDLHERIIEEAANCFRTRVIALDSQDTFYRLATVQPHVAGSPRSAAWSLPPAFYITSYTQLSGNGVKEIPGGELCPYAEGIGTLQQGIKCLYSPSLADLSQDVFSTVAIDEGVRLQGGFNTIIGAGILQMHAAYRLVLTATPIKNRLPQIFYLAWFATGALPEAHARLPYKGNDEDQLDFAKTYLIAERNVTKEELKGKRFRKLSPQVCNVHGLWKLFAPIILRRRKKDIGEDIVAKRKEIIRVPMGSRQRDVYEYHLKALYKDDKNRPAPGAKLQALRSVAGDPTSRLLEPVADGDDDRGIHYRSTHSYTPKMAASLKLISQLVSEGEQVVVFSAFLDPLDTLQHRLDLARVPSYKLDGRSSPKKRGSLSLHFGKGRDSGIPVILGGVESIAEGHNWPKASHVLLIAYSWALDKMLQAVDRVYRLNSVKDVTVHCIICDGTVDRKLESLLDEKEDAAELVLDGRLMGDNPQEVNLAELLNIAMAEFDSGTKTIDEAALERDEWPLVKRALEEAMTSWQQKITLDSTKLARKKSPMPITPSPIVAPVSTFQPPPMPRWQRPAPSQVVTGMPPSVVPPADLSAASPAIPDWKKKLWRRTYETCDSPQRN